MSDVLISGLPANGTLTANDLLELEQPAGPSSNKVTLADLSAFINSLAAVPVDTVTALSISAGVVTVDLNGGRNKNFNLLLTADVTSVVFTNLPAAGFVGQADFQITQDGTGGRTFAIPAAFKATGGSDTAIASAIGAVTILSSKTWDQGTTWAYAMQERAA